jgi:hypothetical protein
VWLKYSDKPIVFDGFADRKQSGLISAHEKPNGCWITDDSEQCWRAWCESEDWGINTLAYKHEVILDERNICILRTAPDLDAFTREFKAIKIWGPPGSPRRYADVCIDWANVANKFDGLIITPYQWQRRLHDDYSWYYGWDCASGCIWKASAIKDIRLIQMYTRDSGDKKGDTRADIRDGKSDLSQ